MGTTQSVTICVSSKSAFSIVAQARETVACPAGYMISTNLARRLEQLEACVVPPGEPEFITVEYVSPDGQVVDSHTIQLGAVRPPKLGATRLAGRDRAPSAFRDRSR